MRSKKKKNPDHLVEKAYSVPLGDEVQLVGDENVGKVMVACIDKPLAESLGVTALMFHSVYIDTDGKVYTDAIQKPHPLMPPQAGAVRWANHDEFLDNTDILNATTASKILGRIRTAVLKGDLPPEKPEKKGGKRAKEIAGFKIW